MTPIEKAQIEKWAAELKLPTSEFVRLAAEFYVHNLDENDRNDDAEKQTALTVNISNRLTDIEQSLLRLEAIFGTEDKDTHNHLDQNVMPHFQELFRTLQANANEQLAQTERLKALNQSLVQEIRLAQHHKDHIEPHADGFFIRLLRAMER